MVMPKSIFYQMDKTMTKFYVKKAREINVFKIDFPRFLRLLFLSQPHSFSLLTIIPRYCRLRGDLRLISFISADVL